MATKSQYGTPLTGLPAFLAGLPRAATPRGGTETGMDGQTARHIPAPDQAPNDAAAPPDFQGMGAWLEVNDQTLFRTIHELVLRQELLARNHLAADTYWTYVKLGYPWATLERPVDNKSAWECVLPPGVGKLTPQAVPNQTWNLVNKACETLLVDLPQPDPTALNDSERAEQAAERATQFLTQYAGSAAGLDTPTLAFHALDAALVRCSSYTHYWVDRTGGGSVPLQIEAHPQAPLVSAPLVGPDGRPTTDPVLRYVTPPAPDPSDPMGPPVQQFTEDPQAAARQWVPRLRADLWGREHIRVFPETADIRDAEQIVGLWYSTVAAGRTRWPDTVGQMAEDEIGALCSWTPLRYLPLLPPQLRARWQINTGSPDQPHGSSDQRVFFYYIAYQRARPETPEGAHVVVSGMQGGRVLHKDTLGLSVLVPSDEGAPERTERRCMEIPINQLRPRVDADERDPSGRAFVELFGAAAEFNATLAMSYLEVLDQTLHLERYATATSPVQGFQIEESRASGDAIPVLSLQDRPQQGIPPVVPPGMLEVMTYGQDQIQDMASVNKPFQDQGSHDVSGKARQLAVAQQAVGLSRMQQATNGWFTRHYRILLELAQREFDAPLMIRFAGADQAYEVAWFNAEDFALVGDVAIKPGTGTMMTPDAKVNYALPLLQQGLMSHDEALDIIKPSYARVLGTAPTPQETRVERALSAWLAGPPPGWVQQVAAWPGVQAQAQQAQAVATAHGLPAPPMPAPPWTPFTVRANDSEPAVAAIWMRRTSDVMAGGAFSRQPDAWQALLVAQYTTARNTLAQAQAPAQHPAASPPQDQSMEQFVQAVDQKTLTAIQAIIAKAVAQATTRTAPPAPAAPPAPPHPYPPITLAR